MDEERLDKLLAEIREESIPAAPGNLESRVLRAVRTAEPEQPGFIWPGWFSLPQFGLAVVVIAVGLGLMIGSVTAIHSKAQSNEHMRQLFALDVFGSNPLGLPHP
tara:strand:- start:20020 stop:20334 length:315 start_codon:yes stop_codon:yes gene_type:complete